MLLKTRFHQHLPCVTAHTLRHSGPEKMMVIEAKPMWCFGNRSFIRHDMAVILADIFKVAFEGAYSDRVKVDHACLFLNFWIVKHDAALAHHTIIKTAYLTQHAPEIFRIHSATQTFAQNLFVLLQMFRHTSSSEHIREIKLAAWLQYAKNLAEHGLLVGGKIYHAVGDDDINGIILNAKSL